MRRLCSIIGIMALALLLGMPVAHATSHDQTRSTLPDDGIGLLDHCSLDMDGPRLIDGGRTANTSARITGCSVPVEECRIEAELQVLVSGSWHSVASGNVAYGCPPGAPTSGANLVCDGSSVNTYRGLFYVTTIGEYSISETQTTGRVALACGL